jgi:DNA-binding transcriptional MocR family regulator
VAKPGDLIVSECLTYVVLPQIVKRLGMRLEGIRLDPLGLIPESFEALCRARKPKALYCNPTVQNPTATVMPDSRRVEIANIARRHSVAIIEDDVIGALHGPTPRPLSAIAPDITWYCMSLSKCFAMGLRVAYVVAPDKTTADALMKPVQNLSSWFPPSLSLMVVADWIKTGVGRQISSAIHDEMAGRQHLAATLLEEADYTTAAGALHLWLHLPTTYDPLTFCQAAARTGVALRPSTLFRVDDSSAPSAVRISLSSPTRRVELETGLRRIATLLRNGGVAV